MQTEWILTWTQDDITWELRTVWALERRQRSFVLCCGLPDTLCIVGKQGFGGGGLRCRDDCSKKGQPRNATHWVVLMSPGLSSVLCLPFTHASPLPRLTIKCLNPRNPRRVLLNGTEAATGTLLLTGGCRHPDSRHRIGAGGCSSIPRAIFSVAGSQTRRSSFPAIPEVASLDAQGPRTANGDGAVKKARSSERHTRCSLAIRKPRFYVSSLRPTPSGTFGNAFAFRFVPHAPSARRQRAQLSNHSLSAGPLDGTQEWPPREKKHGWVGSVFFRRRLFLCVSTYFPFIKHKGM